MESNLYRSEQIEDVGSDGVKIHGKPNQPCNTHKGKQKNHAS